MTVDELREKLAGVPGHIPVVIEQTCDDLESGGACSDYLITLDTEISAFPTLGRMFVILLGDKSKGWSA